jgi:ABC-type multidrug transport system fused ATPase/permease subunit
MLNFLKKLCNWRFLICFGLAWIITNGWCYVFIFLGTTMNIKWMLSIGTSYLAFLWMPWTPEKLITIPIAIFLLKILFPKQKKLQEELKKEFDSERKKISEKNIRRINRKNFSRIQRRFQQKLSNKKRKETNDQLISKKNQ